MHAIDRSARAATRWLALVGFAGLLLLAIMTTLDVLLRWLFAAPLSGVNDVSAVVMAVVIASCIPANLSERKNISVEVAGALLGRRADGVFSLFASAVTFVVFALMAWQFARYTQGAFESGRRTWVLALPVWPWWTAATLFIAFGALVQLLNVVADGVKLAKGRSDGASTHDEQARDGS